MCVKSPIFAKGCNYNGIFLCLGHNFESVNYRRLTGPRNLLCPSLTEVSRGPSGLTSLVKAECLGRTRLCESRLLLSVSLELSFDQSDDTHSFPEFLLFDAAYKDVRHCFHDNLGRVDQSESMAGQCKVLCRTAVSILVSAVMMCNGDPDIIRLDWKWQILNFSCCCHWSIGGWWMKCFFPIIGCMSW